MNFVPDIATLLQFSLASIVLTITPGPDMTLILSRTLSQGRAAGIASMLGASSGILLHSLFVVVGLSAVIKASPTAFGAIKIAGGLYLLFLAYDALRNGSALTVDTNKRPASLRKSYLTGIGINLLNPKIILFYLSFLPQFVEPNDPLAPHKLGFLGVYFLVVALPIVVVLIFAAENFSQALKNNPSIARWIDYSVAAIFIIFALKMILDV